MKLRNIFCAFSLWLASFTPAAEAFGAARLESLTVGYSNAKQTDANLIVEASFMRRIEENGYLRALYKK